MLNLPGYPACIGTSLGKYVFLGPVTGLRWSTKATVRWPHWSVG